MAYAAMPSFTDPIGREYRPQDLVRVHVSNAQMRIAKVLVIGDMGDTYDLHRGAPAPPFGLRERQKLVDWLNARQSDSFPSTTSMKSAFPTIQVVTLAESAGYNQWRLKKPRRAWVSPHKVFALPTTFDFYDLNFVPQPFISALTGDNQWIDKVSNAVVDHLM